MLAPPILASHRDQQSRLQQLAQNAQPITAQNFLDLIIAETAFDQLPGQVARVSVISKIGQKMRLSQLRFDFLAFGVRHLSPEHFAEIETDSDPFDPDQAGDVFDMVDITIDRRFLFARPNENRVDANHSTTLSDHPDLLVTDVAFDVVESASVAV